MNTCIIGAGAWGTAMAIHLARCGHTVSLATRTIEQAMLLTSTRENRSYLPGCQLDANIQIGCELKPLLMEAELVFLAVPSQSLRTVCQALQQSQETAHHLRLVIALCKGLEQQTRLAPCELIAEELPDLPCAVLTGPTFAGEIAIGRPAAMVLSGKTDLNLLESFQKLISNTMLRVYTSSDYKGVQLGGCLKNVYAIAAGICDGLQLGDNAKASLLTRALAEMVRFGTELGGATHTFYGLSGFGDLIATSNGLWSRNRTFGQKLAQGAGIQPLVYSMTIEGYYSTASFSALAKTLNVKTPILEELNAVLYKGKDPKMALVSLMDRDLKQE